jgi:Nif-specific regulatory protein
VSIVQSVDAESVASVLAEIAEIASETLELQEVFDRVATAVRRIIPFENMGVVRIVDGEHAVLHACTVPCKGPEFQVPIPLTSWSPRMRPRPGPNPRINDALAEFDPSFPIDAQCLEGGVRSGMWEPFRSSDSLRGGVWLCSYQAFAFSDEHQELLRPIAALLGSAVEHWRIWDAERSRRERLDQAEAILGTVAATLDVGEIFQQLSAAMQPILPHTMMVLTELDLDACTIRIRNWAGECDLPVTTDPVPMTARELAQRVNSEIVHDIPEEVVPDTERKRLIIGSGLRSWLRVPVLLSGEVNGGLSFFHRDPSRYDRFDAEVAGRLADRIALVMSHQRLAEEARVAAESRERAEQLEARVETLARELDSREHSRVVGISPSWKETLRQVERVTAVDTTVLISGESGTGKEVIAKLVHQGSPRARKPFVAINCAALPEQLLESELFGHERGAFTGAVATKVGRIEQAEGGTLFLDEIAEMSPIVQAKLLRVLEEREFQRVGGTRTLKADVRVIAATNRDLQVSIARQQFREDLFYRLNVFQIQIAPLRQRIEDILPLAESFLQGLGRTMGRPAAGISRDAREWLLGYSWPGNARELRNAIERAILLCDGGLITRDHLPAPMLRPDQVDVPRNHGSGNGFSAPAAPPRGAVAEDVNLGAMERDFIAKALSQSRGNKSQAARLLGLTRAQLYWRLEKYDLH